MTILGCILCAVGITFFVVSLFCLAFDFEPFALWVTLLIIGVVVLVGGGIISAVAAPVPDSGRDCIKVEHQEQSPDYGYNYCPNCGYELQKGI